uniref:FLYWCH-type domain-containing protein n=1 Tax=Strongyloides papillosus TaxID=174720 RepID=A0A0N5B5R3_STREA
MDDNIKKLLSQLSDEECRKLYESLRERYSPERNQDSRNTKDNNFRKKKKDEAVSINILQEVENLPSDNRLSENKQVSAKNTLQKRAYSAGDCSISQIQKANLSSCSEPNMRRQNSGEVFFSESSKNSRIRRRTLHYIAVAESQDTEVDQEHDGPENQTNSEVFSPTPQNDENQQSLMNTSERANIEKEKFMEKLKTFCSGYDQSIAVNDKFIVGLYTERTKNGLWLLTENQPNYINPLGRMFTKKRGSGYNVLSKTTTYWCRNCRKSKKPNWPYGDCLVELKIKNKQIQSISGTHHERCCETSFKQIMAEEFLNHSIALAKNPVIMPNVSFILGEQRLLSFASYFKFELEELKTYFGEYHSRARTLRSASSRNVRKNKDGKISNKKKLYDSLYKITK